MQVIHCAILYKVLEHLQIRVSCGDGELEKSLCGYCLLCKIHTDHFKAMKGGFTMEKIVTYNRKILEISKAVGKGKAQRTTTCKAG